MKNSKIVILVFAALVVGVITGYVLSHKPQTVTLQATGTTNSTAKVLSIKMDLSSPTGTTTSIAIPQDYAVANSFAYCTSVGTSKTAYTGAGLASLLINGATTSSAVTGNLADYNTNYATESLLIGTSTTFTFASSTNDVTGFKRYLPQSAFYTFSANATNTAQCTVGVNVIAI